MEKIWLETLKALEKKIDKNKFSVWLKPIKYKSYSDRKLTLAVLNQASLSFVKQNFLSLIESEASIKAGNNLDVILTIELIKEKEYRVETQSEIKKKPKRKIFNQLFTFENFVTGKANQLARAAALQISTNPNTNYNPLFIYGGVGLGKTHLMHAIGNNFIKNNPERKIHYVHAERYVSDVVKAYQNKSFDQFKNFYHNLDILLIDDIQFFGNKNRTQEEFFYAYNALIDDKRQVVISCDSYPKQINGIEDRLISRFGWGLTVEIEPPEFEMRVAILLKKASLENIKLPEEVAFFLANIIESNVRELEGALKRVSAYANFNNQDINLELSKIALKDLLFNKEKKTSIQNIKKIVADYFKIKTADFNSQSRARTIVRPRQIAMSLCKELTNESLPEIGKAFGGKDHSTVLHAMKKIKQLSAENMLIKHDYENLKKIIVS
ncbi:MAG: chromosomal replication initiator protein DnaA [Hydrogenophilales bacterium]